MPGPTKAQRDRAVKALRLYSGSEGRVSVKDAQRLYARYRTAMKALESFAEDAHEQVAQEATRLGPIRPLLGRDL